MNDLIERLAEQCYEHDQSWTGVGQRIFNKEKFAELIVRECIDICLRNHINNIETISAGECAYDIQEHFGVE